VLSPDGRTAITIGIVSGTQVALVFDLARVAGDDGVIPKEQPRPPSEPIELKQRWASPIAIYPARRVDADPATNLLLLGSDEGIAAFDLKTGLPKKEFATLTATKAHGLFPLDKERFATLTPGRDDFEIWESRTGKLSERLTVPSIPAGPAGANDRYVTLSPNQKYIAIGRVGIPSTDYPLMPFKVVEAATRKPLLNTEWRGGSAYFTADSSRVLVAEWTGRIRWFKLPSGEEDGGWDFGPPRERRISTVLGISADGSKVAYDGPGLLKPGSAQVGVIDGKTGKPVLSVPKSYLDNFAALSADGRRAAFIRFPPDGMEVEWRIDVFDVPSGEMFAYVRFVASRSNPMFEFTPDGKALVVHDCNGVKAKAYLFDIVDPGAAEIGIKDPAPEVIEVDIAPGVRMKMCWIPPGEAQLGSLEAERDEVKKIKGGAEVNWDKNESEEVRGKFKTKGFWMGKYEVTQNEWKAVMGKNPSDFVPGQEAVAKAGIVDTGRFPVEKVSWDDCHEFMKKLNASVKLPAKMGTGKFALPHEDQWEYAARGGKGNKQAFYFGDVLSLKSANCFSPFDGSITFPLLRPAVVGSYEKEATHPWGLCDMAGNVFEWCENAYRLGDSARVIRGGSWGDPGWNARSANRVRWDHDRRESNVGLRVCFFPE
jgi:formylglycine-generating enzyme